MEIKMMVKVYLSSLIQTKENATNIKGLENVNV